MIVTQNHQIHLSTRGRGLYEITRDVVARVRDSEIQTGLATLFLQHTSASLLIQENADPEVRADLERFFRRLIPDGDPLLEHTTEGPDDMPAHIRTALTSVSLSIPIAEGRMALGTWQGIYIWEHRLAPPSPRSAPELDRHKVEQRFQPVPAPSPAKKSYYRSYHPVSCASPFAFLPTNLVRPKLRFIESPKSPLSFPPFQPLSLAL